MQKNYSSILKYALNLTFILCLILLMSTSKSIATSDKSKDKKVVALVLDEVSLEELLNSNTPNIDMLLNNGAMAFMNTRAKSSLSNRGSTYLSLGMGVRTLASSEGGLAFKKDFPYTFFNYNLDPNLTSAIDVYSLYADETSTNGDILNIAIGDIKRVASNITPNNQVGLLGKIAKENNLTIGVVGNSDSDVPAREITMLAMDENGSIPFGYVDSDLLVADKNILGGFKLDQEKLLEETMRILPNIDMLFVDYGDTVRVEKSKRLAIDSVREEQKSKAIERADSFLGKIMNKVSSEETLFLVIAPNTSRDMSSQGNFGLTPIIMSGHNTQKGLLTSNTTRRQGLVTNFDFAPTVLDFFDIDSSKNFIGDPVQVVASKDPINSLLDNQSQYLYLRKYRNIFHWSFIVLVIMNLVGLYLPRFTRWKGFSSKLLSNLSVTVFAVPLTMMTVSLFGYKFLVFDLVYVFGGAFILSYIFNKIFNRNLMSMTVLGLVTSFILLIDVFFIKNLMIVSPLGSDAIAGGRFYGIGNDYMGILLGSTLLGFFSLLQIYNVNKFSINISITIYMLLITIGLSPFFGANMGGTLSAMLVTLLVLLKLFDKKFSVRNILLLSLAVFVGIIVLASLDYLFNSNPTHAGKAIESLISGGWNKLFEIISIKLKQVFWNLTHASWNIVLFLQIALMFLLYKFKVNIFNLASKEYPFVFKGFNIMLLAGLFIFLFNDTGTIAAALILTYLFIPLGLLLNKFPKV